MDTYDCLFQRIRIRLHVKHLAFHNQLTGKKIKYVPQLSSWPANKNTKWMFRFGPAAV